MRLTTRVVVAISASSVIAAVALLWYARHTQREATQSRLADTITAAMEAGGRERCEVDPERFVRRRLGRGLDAARPRRRALGESQVGVYDAHGRSTSGESAALPPAMLRALEEGTSLEIPGARADRGRFLVRMPWDDGPCVIVAVERARVEGQGVPQRGLLLVLLVLVVAALAAVLALRSPLARLRALSEAARALERSGFRDRAALDRTATAGADEITELGASLRTAVHRIARDAEALTARDAALTEYVVHTTHDLMTPITVLTGHLAELDDDLARGKPVDARTVERALGEAHYLATLVANLGVVARLDRPDPIVQKRALDLRDVVERVVARHVPLARAKGLSLEHAVPERAVPFDGDDLLLERALGNLVHNAIRHHRAREGTEGHVAIVLEREGASFRLRVLDDGTGLDDATLTALQRSGEPSEASRSRTQGFGMDVVRRVATLHGLRLAVERASEGGLSVTLSERS